LKHARHANHCAQLIAELVKEIPGVELMFTVQANCVFLQMSEPAIEALTNKGWLFFTFMGDGCARFM
ncbi:threonine aldolase, partial [Pseudomonas sp. RTI1]|nr:threonine aldolase [Pseudomonas sp. RTI1]